MTTQEIEMVCYARPRNCLSLILRNINVIKFTTSYNFLSPHVAECCFKRVFIISVV